MHSKLLQQSQKMEKRQTLKQPLLRKMNTMAETKRQQWALPSDYLKVLLLLSITRKITRVTGKTIKDSQDKQNSQLGFLKKTYSNRSCNSFDFIAPIKRKLIQVKLTRQAFLELKKDMLQFLKNVRFSVKKNLFLKKAETTGQFSFTPNSTTQFSKTLKHDNSLFLVQPNIVLMEPTTRKQPIVCKQYQQAHKFQQVVFNRQQSRTKSYCMNRTRKLRKKIQSESIVFKRFNYTLSKFYNVPDSSGTVKGSLQLFQFYLSSLYEVKNSVTVHFFQIFSQKKQCKQRIFYEINEMNQINRVVLTYCKVISESHQIAKAKVLESIQKCNQLSENKIGQISQDQNLSQFIKKSCIMIEVIKNILIIPYLSQILINKVKLFTELFEKLSQFRYFARYLSIEIANMNKKGTQIANGDDQISEYAAKWRKVFDRKFKPLKINAKQI